MKKTPAKVEMPKRQAPAQRKPPRQIEYTSQRCFKLARLGWEWSLASLPLDIAIVLMLSESPSELSVDGEVTLVILVVVAAIGTLREQIFTLIGKLRHLQMKIEQRHIKYILLVLGAIGGAEIIARVFAHTGGPPPAFVIIAAIAILASVARSFKKLKQHGEKFLSDHLAQVEQANTLHLSAVGVPLAAARLVGLCVAFQTADLTSTLLGSCTALVLILALHPTQRDFMAPCPKCQQMTSRVLKAEGYCPNCSPEKFS